MTNKWLDENGLQTLWNDILEKFDEEAYELPAATTSALGGVKPDGTTITVDADGTIHGQGGSSAVSGVKGDAESTYRTGDVNITPANIGAAALASPAFTGVPTAPTAAAGTDTTQIATTAFVNQAIDDMLGAIANASY